jgi:chromate transporter
VSLERLFLTVLLANLIGFGGLSSIPVVRGQLLAVGLPADALILHAVAVGNISPGPNGLYLVAIGYFIGGFTGAAIAVLALLMPPALVLVLERARSSLVHLHRFRAGLHSLSLAVIALLVVSSGSLAVNAASDTIGLLIVIAGLVMMLCGVPSLVSIAVAVLAGILFH